MKRVDLTDDQHLTLIGILRERIEARAHARSELIAQGAGRGLVDMADAAIVSLTELVVACGLAMEAPPPVGHALLEDGLNLLRRRSYRQEWDAYQGAVDDSGATGTQRSDWSGEGDEQP